MTRYVKIEVMKNGDPPKFTYDGFTPWINCGEEDTVEYVTGLAIHRFLREYGYLNRSAPGCSPAERKPLDLAVYHYDDSTPRHSSGRPMTVNYVHMTVHPK